MNKTQNDLVLLTRGHIVLFDDVGKITVLERLSHRVVYHGPPSGEHPISSAARQIYELAASDQLPASFPQWDPYPHDKPTVAGFALYEVSPGLLPSRDTFLYYREAMRHARNKRRSSRRKK